MNGWPLVLLRWLVGEDQSEILEGDVLELYEERKQQKGPRVAALMQWYDVMDVSRSFIRKRESRRYRGMNKNLIKVIFRNMARRKLMTGVNLFGLSIAMFVALLIVFFVGHELSYDRYHQHGDRVYRVTIEDSNADGLVEHWSRVYADWVNDLPEVFPQVEEMVRIQSFRPRNVLVERQKFREEHAYAVDEEIFEVFDFAFLLGDRSALEEAQSVVLTESTSKKYFGTFESLGREVTMQGHDGMLERYTVTAVIKDQPGNTHLPVTLMTSLEDDNRNGWAYIYLKLQDPPSATTVQAGLEEFVSSRTPEDSPIQSALHLQPLTSIHLHSQLAREIAPNGRLDYVVIFAVVALVILLVAAINFANLNTVQSLDRAKEIGVRKVLGADRGQISRYFLMEALILSVLSGLLALGVLLGLLPAFQQFMGTEMYVEPTTIVLALLTMVAVTTIFSGAYPSRILAKYQPMQALKGMKKTGRSKLGIRKVMLAWQFALSIGLISATFITQRQFNYIHQKNLGYNGDQIMAIRKVPDQAVREYETFKSQLRTIPGVDDVSALMELPTQAIRDAGFVLLESDSSNENAPRTDIQIVDLNADKFLELQLVAGSGLPQSLRSGELHPPQGSSVEATFEFVNARRRAYLINQSAARLLGWDDPQQAIGQRIAWSNGFLDLATGPITGVVEDFHQESLRSTIDPVVMVYEPIFLHHVLVKLEGKQIRETIERIENTWNQSYAEFPMDVTFLDQEFATLYKAEGKQLQLIKLFSMLALSIAFLGLLGLISYTLKLRLKEMAIRKVLGATMQTTVQLFAREYLMVLIAGAIIAVPSVWILMSRWLENYAYHTTINGLSFVVAMVVIVLLMGITLISQAWKAESTNPSEILKQE